MVVRILLLALAFDALLFAGLDSDKVMYVGGTFNGVPERTEGKLALFDEKTGRFNWNGGEVQIPYDGITSLEYGQKAGRRIGVAIIISPIALLSKKRKHYLTLGFTDANGKKQGAVFELGKDVVRTSLVALEARSGKKIEYESEEAKKNIGN